MKKLLILCLMLSVAVCTNAQKKTVKKKAVSPTEARVIGKHLLTLQWISWDYYGSCNITKEKDGTLKCVGEQLSKEAPGDYVRLDGTVEIVDKDHLKFTGTIAIRVHYNNGGQECLREGTFDFVTKPGRKYWRLQQQDNPCEGIVDYVDIYYKK
jgi:hypothetical protein